MTTQTLTSRETTQRHWSLRVLPASRGAWRVEDGGTTRGMCATPAEAEQLAERLLRELGGGQVLVYDAYLRLRTVKRLPPQAS